MTAASSTFLEFVTVIVCLILFSWLLKHHLTILSTSNANGVQLLALVRSIPWSEAIGLPRALSDPGLAQRRLEAFLRLCAAPTEDSLREARSIMDATEESLNWVGMSLPNNLSLREHHHAVAGRVLESMARVYNSASKTSSDGHS